MEKDEKGCNELSSSNLCEQVAVKGTCRVPNEPNFSHEQLAKVSKSLSSSAAKAQSKTFKTRNEMEQALNMFEVFEVQLFFLQLESCANVFCTIFDFPRDLSIFQQLGAFGYLESRDI